jgi:Mg-chelatase subunit ChlD
MKIHRAVQLVVMAAVPFLAACSDSTGPKEKPIAQLTISGVSMNAESFQNKGEFGLGLLATDASGESILSTKAKVTATVTGIVSTNLIPSGQFAASQAVLSSAMAAGGYTITVGKTATQAGKSNETYAAILLDDSGSMDWNDPDILRADAAQIFWEEVLRENSKNRVALLDFGQMSSEGFSETRLLQGWTRDQAELEAQLPNIEAWGGTPLYTSLNETALWVDSTVAKSPNRVMLLLSDGQPGDYPLEERRDEAIATAKKVGLRVHTVGLGEASDLDEYANTNAIEAVREIAEQTGGVYSAATDADAMRSIFQALAQVSSQGQLLTTFKIAPVPPSGTRVSGTVTVTIGGKAETASWSFVAP